MTDGHAVTDELRRLEEALLRPALRRDSERLRQLLTADFEEVGASGRVFGREEIIALLSREQPAENELTLDHFRARWLADNLVQVRYQSRRHSPEADQRSERTSIWKYQADRWVLIYHQGTPVPSR